MYWLEDITDHLIFRPSEPIPSTISGSRNTDTGKNSLLSIITQHLILTLPAFENFNQKAVGVGCLITEPVVKL